ncbi:hypothetical protein [Paractinoplanes deccanensis]|nr:hypothetical protein [Actinoplanes deccanensis]
MRTSLYLRLLAVLATLPVTACTGGSDRPLPARPPSITPYMPDFVRAADGANAQQPGTVIAAGARPTVTDQGAGAEALTIRDQGQEAWAAGTYRLVVHCAGLSGALRASFTLGAASRTADVSSCTPGVTTQEVVLRLATGASSSEIVITPAGVVQAAVSYQVLRG